jgi:peptidase E
MTKYVLHGGLSSRKFNAKPFFLELAKGMRNPKILCVYFAREKNLWHSLFQQDKLRVPSALPQKKPKLILADPEKFRSQAKSSDIIYIRGGENIPLKKALKPIKNLKESFKDKVVGGSSAGANILSKYYYSTDDDRIEKGLGILPIKVFVHYSKKDSKKLEKLKKYGENLKTYAIPEEKQFVVS